MAKVTDGPENWQFVYSFQKASINEVRWCIVLNSRMSQWCHKTASIRAFIKLLSNSPNYCLVAIKTDHRVMGMDEFSYGYETA